MDPSFTPAINLAGFCSSVVWSREHFLAGYMCSRLVISCICRERHEGLAAHTKSLAAGTLRRALVAVAADSQVAVMDAETGFTLSK
jgi:hypothetical protein